MNHVDREAFRRLGAEGLRRVLEDLLDSGRLVRLANACGLRYPGMRTRSQKRERILVDLVEKAGGDEAARRAIYKTLAKEARPAARAWAGLAPEERERRLKAATLDAGESLGLRLFVLATSTDPTSQEALAAVLARGDLKPDPAAAPAAPGEPAQSREVARLRKKIVELQKKVQYVEGQLAKGRETEKTLKRELMQRKGELAESRMLVERLRREPQPSREPSAAAAAPAAPPAVPKGLEGLMEEIAKTHRKLQTEHRKLAHALDKIASLPPEPAAPASEALSALIDGVEEVKKETQALRRDRKKDEQAREARLDALQAELRAMRAAAEQAAPPGQPGRRRSKGAKERVGVFIDVQNMYYAARQLKGKLDFDALLQAAVRDRRLIQAKAYVVESQEIDQSGFIAMLQQRAIEVRRKTLRVRSDGSMKGDWDMEMALEILDAAPQLDVVVLVSGDGDFTSLVNRVKGMGPRVEVLAFPRNTAKSLLEAADHFQPLDRKFTIRSDAEHRRPGESPPARAESERGSGSRRSERESGLEDEPAPSAAVAPK